MGDEYEYLIGSVAEDAGTPSVFRSRARRRLRAPSPGMMPQVEI